MRVLGNVSVFILMAGMTALAWVAVFWAIWPIVNEASRWLPGP